MPKNPLDRRRSRIGLCISFTVSVSFLLPKLNATLRVGETNANFALFSILCHTICSRSRSEGIPVAQTRPAKPTTETDISPYLTRISTSISRAQDKNTTYLHRKVLAHSMDRCPWPRSPWLLLHKNTRNHRSFKDV
jgi:hypothetical protein